jgi:DNA-binding response OmpR family regulator
MNVPILVIEDDASINQLLCETLQGASYQPQSAFSGSEALLLLPTQQWKCIILDLMLPGKTGEEVLATLRENTATRTTPVIALSARTDRESKLTLLTNGADDYITKPFDIDELLARVAIQLRRFSAIPVENQTFEWLDISLAPASREVWVNNQPLTLTKREFDILALLIRHPQQVYSRATLFENVWQQDYVSDDKTVNVHISNLRNKLHALSPHRHIKSVWGVGFRLAL